MNETTNDADNGDVPSAAEAVAMAIEATKSDIPDPEPQEELKETEETQSEADPEDPEGEQEDEEDLESEQDTNDVEQLKQRLEQKDRGVAKLKEREAALKEKLQSYENLEAALGDPTRNVEIVQKIMEAAGLTVEDLTGEQWQGNESALDRRLRAAEQRLAQYEQREARAEALSKAETNIKAAVKAAHGYTPTRDLIRQAQDELPQVFEKDPVKAFEMVHAQLLIKHAKGQAQAPKKTLPTMVEGTGMPKDEADFDYTSASLSEMVAYGLNRAKNSQAS